MKREAKSASVPITASYACFASLFLVLLFAVWLYEVEGIYLFALIYDLKV